MNIEYGLHSGYRQEGLNLLGYRHSKYMCNGPLLSEEEVTRQNNYAIYNVTEELYFSFGFSDIIKIDLAIKIIQIINRSNEF